MISIGDKKNIPVFPLSGAILLPNANLPLNIFEERYVQLINDCMKGDRLFGMVQPKLKKKNTEVYSIGCLGKIISFNEVADKRFIISLSGLIRYKILKELSSEKLYRQFQVDYSDFSEDLTTVNDKKEKKPTVIITSCIIAAIAATLNCHSKRIHIYINIAPKDKLIARNPASSSS